ncbi:cell wall-associated NlpC family hydrolase [Evansella vedderi]|uniref:Cell wall-associated NlpC family hydrolase n=1 Tax=Evansella vedderi TaxID=38282 RepID=A0ABT9ZX34_9BACI|nr:peptidoglycan-binding protein [Evansella vedderi]MDQ0255798.1 cell wall-associated NlpC family hydrolase [Evansella vedderi]
MSKFNLKDHKGTVIFTSVVAGAALAPILTGQLHHEGQQEKNTEIRKPLTSNAPVETINQHRINPIHPLQNAREQWNRTSESSSKTLTASAHTERNITFNKKIDSLDDFPPLRLVSEERGDSEEFNLASEIREMRSVWPEDTLLNVGDEGPKVETIQRLLKEIGYFIHDVDGVYNTKTKNAVRLYQKDHGLMIDGIVGNETITHLVGTKQVVTSDITFAQYDQGSNVFFPDENSETTVFTNQNSTDGIQKKDNDIDDRSYYKYGDVHEEIIELQELLNKAGYFEGVFDGIYGSSTQQAVRMLQREQNLTVDGLAGNQVFTFLRSNDLKKIAENRQQVQQSTSTSAATTTSTSASVEGQESSTSSSTVEKIISRAQELIGSSYLWGGTTPAGFDCSGFLVYVYRHAGKELPRTVADIWNASSSVSSPKRGDLVFFETYKPGPSHAGIYLGDGAFIHTGSSGTQISYLNETYWERRYLGAKRF